MSKLWTVNELRLDEPFAKALHGDLEQGRWGINSSTILTKLIQEAGRWCESFASDLFIEWELFLKRLDSADYAGERLAFGFRQMGVDHDSFIECKVNDTAYGGLEAVRNEYRAIWVLDVSVQGTEFSMTLCKAHI